MKERTTIRDPTEIANCFNTFFSSVGQNIANELQIDTTSSIEKYMTDQNAKTLFLVPVTEQEIDGIISSQNAKTSVDYYGISMKLVRSLREVLKNPLCELINLSFEKGKFPTVFKVALIHPIHKRGSTKELTNYRPIALLPQLSKVLEKAFEKRLSAFVRKSNVLSQCQYGFRKHTSTEMTVVDFIETVNQGIEYGWQTAAVTLDLAKAFDVVDRELLIKKLAIYGIRGTALNWIGSYFENRRQHLKYNTILSKQEVVNYGVPQGSILGPILFIIFINDMPNCSPNSDFFVFADDTNIVISAKDTATLQTKMNECMKEVSTWLLVNRLKVNTSKCEAIFFSKTLPCRVVLCNRELENSNCIKYLGLLIDKDLKFEEQYDSLLNKLRQCLGMFYKIQRFVDIKTKLTIYHSLFHSRLLYCCTCFGSKSALNKAKIESIQYRILKLVFACSEDNLKQNMTKHRILSYTNIIQFETMMLMWKAFHKLLPERIQARFTRFIDTHDRNSISSHNFNVKRYTTKSRRQCLSSSGVKIWNSMPKEIKQAANLREFKNLTKDYLIANY